MEVWRTSPPQQEGLSFCQDPCTGLRSDPYPAPVVTNLSQVMGWPGASCKLATPSIQKNATSVCGTKVSTFWWVLIPMNGPTAVVFGLKSGPVVDDSHSLSVRKVPSLTTLPLLWQNLQEAQRERPGCRGRLRCILNIVKCLRVEQGLARIDSRMAFVIRVLGPSGPAYGLVLGANWTNGRLLSANAPESYASSARGGTGPQNSVSSRSRKAVSGSSSGRRIRKQIVGY